MPNPPIDYDDHFLPAPPGGIYVGPNPYRSQVNLDQNDIPIDPHDFGDINAAITSGQDLTDEQKQRLAAPKKQPKYRVVGGHLTPDQVAKLSGLYSKSYTGPKAKGSIKYSIGDGPMQEFQPLENPNAPERTLSYAQAMADLRSADDSENAARAQKMQDEDRAFTQRKALLPLEIAEKQQEWSQPLQDLQIQTAQKQLGHMDTQFTQQDTDWAQHHIAAQNQQDQWDQDAPVREAQRQAQLDDIKQRLSPSQQRAVNAAQATLQAMGQRTDPQAIEYKQRAAKAIAAAGVPPELVLGQYTPAPQDAMQALGSLEVQMPLRKAKAAVMALKGRSGTFMTEGDWAPAQQSIQEAVGAMVAKGIPWQQAQSAVMMTLQDASGIPDEAPGGLVGEGMFSSNPYLRQHLYQP